MDRIKRPSNPLALAVLAHLFERPMHPYEMAATMKERGKEKSIKLRYGSLYTVIEALQRDRLIAARETSREGRRPERTIFEITPGGSKLLVEWLSELLSRPSKEYLQFEAGLSLMPVLPPEAAARLLTERFAHLSARAKLLRAELREAESQGVASLFLIEGQYELAMIEAESCFVEQLAGQIARGDLGGIALWRDFHALHAAKKGSNGSGGPDVS